MSLLDFSAGSIRFAILACDLNQISLAIQRVVTAYSPDISLKSCVSHATSVRVPGKLKNFTEIVAIADQARRKGQKVVFTNGCFDLMHRGHLHVLRQAKATGDLLIVGVNTDRSVKMIKDPGRPILSEVDRSELIGSLEMVDYVVLFDDPTPIALISAIKPDVLAKGGDWRPDQVIGADVVRQNGGAVVLIPYLKGFSTTEIIERIRTQHGQSL